jgi:glycine/D-amino acid oxidase-like deaminating enzyme/nitrite reductase/ring-hydroxylating ferredoxin subunit
VETANQETRSLWQKTETIFLPSLSSHEAVDVCVIGGGIAGLTTAYHLLESGKSVALLERSGLHAGQTILSSAHLCSALDDRYFRIRQRHGAEGARLAAASHAFAVDEVERITRTEAIDCDFTRVPGYLFLAPGDDDSLLEKEHAACRDAGLPGVELLSAGHSALFPTGPCLRFPHQARFHPGRYLTGLARAVLRKGGRIYAHTEAMTVEGGRPARVATNRGFQVVSEAVVVATNVPFNDRLTMHTKMAPYRTYLIALRMPRHRQDLSLFWDTGDPYHYVRTAQDVDGEILALVGGEDHRTGQDLDGGDRFQRLRDWARDRLGVEGELRYHWSGQVLEPHDGLAFIGRNPGDDDNVFLVTGDSGNGLTHGTLAGRLLTDLVNGVSNPWAHLYDPARVNLRSLGTFVAENAKGTAPYADWVTTGDVSSVEEIPAGEGAILREGVQKLAVYKDGHGRPHFFSAVCPHMSGIVRWNTVEKTWDCPCHGSRFDRLGHVLNGPAATGLAAIADNTALGEDAVSA